MKALMEVVVGIGWKYKREKAMGLGPKARTRLGSGWASSGWKARRLGESKRGRERRIVRENGMLVKSPRTGDGQLSRTRRGFPQPPAEIEPGGSWATLFSHLR